MQQNISKSLYNINIQKERAHQAYQTGLTSAGDLYNQNVSDLQDTFYEDLAEDTLDLNKTLGEIADQFTQTANTMYENWYIELLQQAGTFAQTGAEVEIGDWSYDWSPFGLDFDPSSAVSYTGPSTTAVCGPNGDQECMPPMDGCGSGEYFSQYCNACVDAFSGLCP